LAGGRDVAGGQVPLRAADGVGEEVAERAQPGRAEVEVDQLRGGDGPGDAYTGVVRLRGLARFRGRRVDAQLQGGLEVVGGRGERAGLHDGRARLGLGLLAHAVAPLTRNALGAGQLLMASLRLSAVSSCVASGNASRSANHQSFHAPRTTLRRPCSASELACWKRVTLSPVGRTTRTAMPCSSGRV